MRREFKLFASFLLVTSLSFFLFVSPSFAEDYNTGNECDQDLFCEKWEEGDRDGDYFVSVSSAKLPNLCVNGINEIRVKAGNGYERYGHSGAYLGEVYGEGQYNGVADYTVTVNSSNIIVNKKQRAKEISHVEIWCNEGEDELLPLIIKKTANTSYTRTWNWSIEKTVDLQDLNLELGETQKVNYTITLLPTPVGSEWTVSGKVVIKNPNEESIMIKRISDIINPGSIRVDLRCKGVVEFPYNLEGGDRLVCSYEQQLEDDQERRNVVKIFSSRWKKADYRERVSFDFTSAIVEDVDECVTISDDKFEDFGEESYVCIGDLDESNQYTYQYSKDITGDKCGEDEFVNTAKLTTNDSKTVVQDSETVDISVGGESCIEDEDPNEDPDDPNGDGEGEKDDEDEGEEDENGDVLGEDDKKETEEIKGATTVVYAKTGASSNALVYLGEGILLSSTLASGAILFKRYFV